MAKVPGGLTSDIQELKFLLSEKEERILKMGMELSNANSDLEATRRQLYEKKAQYNEAEERITDLAADVGKWKMIANRKGSVDATDGHKVQQLETEVARLQQMLYQKDRELSSVIPSDHFKAQIQHVQFENSELNREVTRLKQELTQLQSHNNYLMRQIDELKSQRAQPSVSSGEFERYKVENRRLSDQLKSVEENNVLMHQQCMAYEEDFKREKKDKDDACNKLVHAQEEVRNLQAALQQMHLDRNETGIPPGVSGGSQR